VNAELESLGSVAQAVGSVGLLLIGAYGAGHLLARQRWFVGEPAGAALRVAVGLVELGQQEQVVGRGGRGSMWGSRAGGIVLGVAQTIGAPFDVAWQMLAGLIVFLVVLAVRPQGLFPRYWDGRATNPAQRRKARPGRRGVSRDPFTAAGNGRGAAQQLTAAWQLLAVNLTLQSRNVVACAPEPVHVFLERPEGMDLDDAPGVAAVGRAIPHMNGPDIVCL